MLGLYATGDYGAYLNPAITLSNCIYRQLPWRRFPVCFVAQMLRGFVGPGVVHANYISAIDWFEGGKCYCSYFLHLPATILEKDKSVLLGVHRKHVTHVCDICAERPQQ